MSPEGGPAGTPDRVRADRAMVKALARAHRWQRMLEEGRYASISEMAVAERIDRGYLGRILHLTLLAPDIVQQILDGREPAELGLPTLMEPFPLEWDVQCTALAESARPPASPRPVPPAAHPIAPTPTQH